jgi:hypothetical protein
LVQKIEAIAIFLQGFGNEGLNELGPYPFAEQSGQVSIIQKK